MFFQMAGDEGGDDAEELASWNRQWVLMMNTKTQKNLILMIK